MKYDFVFSITIIKVRMRGKVLNRESREIVSTVSTRTLTRDEGDFNAVTVPLLNAREWCPSDRSF